MTPAVLGLGLANPTNPNPSPNLNPNPNPDPNPSQVTPAMWAQIDRFMEEAVLYG